MQIYSIQGDGAQSKLMVARMDMRKRCVDGCSVDGSEGVDFITEFHALDSELGFRREGRGGCGGGNLWVGGRS